MATDISSNEQSVADQSAAPRFARLPLPMDLTQPWGRRVVLVLVAAVALGVVGYGLLWVNQPPFRPLYAGLEDRNLAEVAQALDRLAIPYRIDEGTGALQVPGDQLHKVRLQLAAEGLPRSGGQGFELLDQPSGFGTSQFMENARYQRALEGELARSIASIGSVRQARVHLAITRQSVFVRDRQPPSASVVIQLEPGRVLDRSQVAAITHLVSSSVPNLTPDRVTVVDQLGGLLSAPERDRELGLSHDQLEFTSRLEKLYVRRIEELLTPIVGIGAVRAQVAVEVDFSVGEETEELYLNPDQPGVRSEQLREEHTLRPGPYGIPGALSNQPPATSQVGDTATAHGGEKQTPLNQRSESTRNYELDKRVRYIRHQPGQVKRVTAAVLLDDKMVRNDDGELVRESFTPEEIERLSLLIRQAVGFDEARGDQVDVMNAAFAASELDQTPEQVPWWKTSWFAELVRIGLFALFGLLVLLMVVRPAMRGLVRRTEVAVLDPEQPGQLSRDGAAGSGARQLGAPGNAGDEELEDDVVRLSMPAAPLDPKHPTDLDGRVRIVKDLISDDPRRAVQVVKQWMAHDG